MRDERGQIDDQGDVEDQTSAVPIRDPAEDKGTDYRSYDVERRNCSKIGAGKMERLGALQGRTQRTHNSDFESVENPGDTQTYDDQQVKPTPGQSIEAERNVGPDHGRGLQLRHPDHFRLPGRVDSRKAAGNRVTTR